MKKELKKSLSILLTIVMIVSMIPTAILTAGAAGEVTINTTSSTSGVVVIGGNSRWSNSTFNIVNDQEAGNTSAGIISYDISSLRGKKITSAKFTAVVDSVDSDNQPTGFFYSTSSACATYVTNGGKETQNVGGNTGAGVIGCNSLLAKLGTTSSYKLGETSSAGTFEFDIKNAVQRLADGNVSTLYVIVAKTKAGGSGSTGGWTDTKVRPAAQRLYVTAENKSAAFTDAAYGSVDWTTPAITTVHGSFYNDNDNVTDAEYAQIYQNLIYAENAVDYNNAAAGTGVGNNTNSNDPFDGNDKVYGVRRMYYPTVVMLYDGQTTPKFGSMFLIDPNTKPWNWNWNNIRAFSAGFSGNQDALTFTGNWRGADGGMNNQWNYISHGDSDVTTYDQSSGYYNTGSGDTRYFSNIITYQGSDFSKSYKTITPSFFNRVGHDSGNSYMTYDSVKSVYVLNYKKALDKIAEMKTFMNSFNQNDWTIKSVNALYTAINNLVQFNPSALKYDYASNTASAVQAAANDMDSLIAAVNTAKANLRHGVTFVFAGGTTQVIEVADGGSVTAPANTATNIETSGNTHTRHTYSWNSTAQNVKTNLTIQEIDTTESVPCNFVRTSTKTEQSCTNQEVAIFTCLDTDGFTGCGATEERVVNPALGHDFTEKVIDDAHLKSAATCKAYAVYYYDCSRCDAIATDRDTNPTFENVDAGYAAHTPGEWITDTPATCTEAGSKHQVCSVCDETIATEKIPATGHQGFPVSGTPATCISTGLADGLYCQLCEKYIQEVLPIDPNNHANIVKDEAVPATCTQTGLTEGSHCSACDTVIVAQTVINALGHDTVNHEAKAPSCTEIGWDAYETCSRCDYTTYVEKAALGHDLVNHEAKAPSCTEIGWDAYDTCSRCDYTTYVEKAALGHDLVSHEAKAPSCTEIGWDAYDTCSRCDYTTYAEKAALGHDLVNHEAKAPTCTEIGWDAYDTCSRCDYTTYVEKAALGHDIVNHDAKAPTCTEIGWDAYDTCSRCDYTTYVEKAALGHDLVNHEAKAPSCTEIGWDAYDTCSRCDYTTYVEKAALGHDLVSHEAKAPTCTEIGWDAYDTCSRCDYTTYAEKAALGHAWGEWTVVDAATCTAKGSEKRVCTNDASHVETREIDMIAHTEEIIPAVPATCEATGLTEGKKCSVCGKILVAQEVVPAKGHNWGEWTVVDAATCTAKGSEKRVCANDASHVETREIDMIAHTEEIIPAVDATCTETGLTEGKKCSVCGEILVAQTVTEALGHDYKTVEGSAVAPTCTTDGKEADQKCSRCDDIITGATIDKRGHTEETIPAVDATCTTTGLTEGKKCSVCGEILVAQEVVPMKAHTPAAAVVENKVDATCLAEGSYDEVVYCSVCGEELSRNTVTIPVTDHNIVSRVDIAPTCTTDGKSSETYCSVCGTIISSGAIIPALGHDVTDEVFKSGASDDGSYAWKTYKCSRCDYKLVTLTLSIYDENGNPLSGANVIIRDADGNIVSQGTSNEYGKYVVAGLPEGAYTVEVSHEASSNVGKGTLVVSNGSVNGTYTEGGRLWNPSGTGGCKGCACHHNNIVSYLIRIFFSIISLIFNKDIKCCPDMVWYPGIK